MDDLEKRLESLSVPEVSVPAFESALRNRLLDSYDAVRSVARMKRFLAVSSTAAAVLLVVSTMFVAKPSLPATINAQLGGAGTEVVERVIERAVGPAAVKPAVSVAARPRAQSPAVANVRTETDLIEVLLREHEEILRAPRVREAEMYSIGRYTLPNDKEIFVLTSFPRDGERRTRPRTIY